VTTFLEVSLALAELQVTVTGRNTSAITVHVFDSPRLPYLMCDEAGVLTVLHGINPPPEDLDLYGFEVLLTRPLASGESVAVTKSLSPLILSNHYGADPKPTDAHGEMPIRGAMAWLSEPVLPAERHLWSLERLLDAQHLVATPDQKVTFP
jgi:hypothetical protein